MSKFFVRLGTYLDSMENFLSEMHSNYMKAIEQKNLSMDLRVVIRSKKLQRAKRTARKLAVNKQLILFLVAQSKIYLICLLDLWQMNFQLEGFEDRILIKQNLL